MDADIISISVFVGFLASYTAYSKTEKRLKPSQLVEIFTFRGGVDKFFVEINKVQMFDSISFGVEAAG